MGGDAVLARIRGGRGQRGVGARDDVHCVAGKARVARLGCFPGA